MVVGMSGEFEEQDSTNGVIGVPRMPRHDTLKSTIGLLVSSKTIVFHIVDGFEQKEANASGKYKAKSRKPAGNPAMRPMAAP